MEGATELGGFDDVIEGSTEHVGFHSRIERRSPQRVAALITLHMQDEELIRLAISSTKTIRKTEGWLLAARNL